MKTGWGMGWGWGEDRVGDRARGWSGMEMVVG